MPRPERRRAAGRMPRGREGVVVVVNDLATGGAQRVAVDQAGWLAQAGFDVTVASLERMPPGAPREQCRDAALAVEPLRRPREPWQAALPRLCHLLATRRPGVVHTHLAGAGVVGRACARASGVPRLLSTLHNLSDWEERAREPLRGLDRRTLRWCDAIVAGSEAIRAAVVRVAPRLAERTRVIRNGVDVERFAVRDERERAATRAALGLAAGDCVVGVVARLEPRKGVDGLLRALGVAVAERPELRLLIVGDGPQRPALEEFVRAARLEPAVRFAGARADVRPWLAAMDVFAAPSRTEGLGLALIEALAAGLPALASRVGGIPEVMGTGDCGRLLPVDDVTAWRDALVEMAGSPATRIAMGAAARRRAARFSTHGARRALVDLYRELERPRDRVAEAA